MLKIPHFIKHRVIEDLNEEIAYQQGIIDSHVHDAGVDDSVKIYVATEIQMVLKRILDRYS